MRYFFTSLLIICIFYVKAQNYSDNSPEVSKDDSLKVAELLALGKLEEDSIKKSDYFEQAISLSKKLHYEYGIYRSYLKIANWKRIQFNPDSAKIWYKKGIADLPEKSPKKIYMLTNLGDEFKKQSNYDSAVFYTHKAIQLAEKYANKKMIVYGYKTLAGVWFQNFKHDKAFLNYAKADSICLTDSILNESLDHAEIYNYMGYVVRATTGYEKAIEYYIKAKHIYEKLNNEAGVQEVNTAIAQAYISFGKNEEALDLLNESIAYQEKIPIRNSYSYAVIVRGFLLLKMGRMAEAEKDYQLYYDLAVKTKDKTFQRRGLGYLASFYAEDKQYNKAIDYYNKSIKLCKEENDLEIEIMEIKGLISAYSKIKNYKKEAETYEEYVALLEQREKQNIKEQTNELEAKYQTQKKEQEISLLKTRNDLAEQEKRNQRNLLLAAIILISLVGLFFFYLYQNRQKTNQKLRELDQVKSTFFTNISHEFRTPLTLISGPVQNLLSHQKLSTAERSNLEMIHRNADRLTDLVDQLLDISKLESGSLKLRVSKGKLMTFIGTLMDGFTFLANQKQIRFTKNISSANAETWFDHDIMEKILVNLLSNALKYTPEKGSVNVDAFVKEEHLNFSIKNTGPGFSKEEMNNVFNRFYQTNETRQGVGIGLALVKELVNLHKGTVTVTSIPDKWTSFVVMLPVNKATYTEKEIAVKKQERLAKNKTFLSSFISGTEINKSLDEKEDKPLLLIVDDNSDVRTYISGLFADSYTVFLAENGAIGIELALKNIPDLIISDIMMPVTDGITLCNTLKTDERTSHIPIILLTAKTGQEHELTGIKTGADDYITKPFKEELLLLKVKNIIATRIKLQERYRQEIILTPKNITVNSTDQQFLEKVKDVLDARLVEPTFGVDNLSDAVGMSRMQLHRKLKALTGLAASEFIRTQRLKLASQMLKESKINISQVGYSVGFNNHAYFSKCFKELYHLTPTEFAKKAN